MDAWKVGSEEEGMTLLSFLRLKNPTLSAKSLKRAIDGKNCQINQKIVLIASHKLKKGDRVSLDKDFDSAAKPSLDILYEDEDLVVCHKPPGLISENRAFNACLPQFKGSLVLVHRLDKETSGVIILAKRAAVKEAMVKLFEKKQVRKTYMALVDGAIEKKEGKIEKEIALKKRYEGRVVYQCVEKGKGQSALTFWKCMRKGKNASLVLCEPFTGRTHQLRIHLSSIGHPILGDLEYGERFRCPVTAKRHLLHAYSIRFTHPKTHKEIEVIAPIPLDFKEIIDKLFEG